MDKIGKSFEGYGVTLGHGRLCSVHCHGVSICGVLGSQKNIITEI